MLSLSCWILAACGGGGTPASVVSGAAPLVSTSVNAGGTSVAATGSTQSAGSAGAGGSSTVPADTSTGSGTTTPPVVGVSPVVSPVVIPPAVVTPPATLSQIMASKSAPAMEDESVWPPAFKALSSSACAGPLVGSHATYEVGPGLTYTELTDVPWLSLQAGDVVNIHYRPTPYKTKIALRAQGTAANPVYINGVTDANCNRPVIDGSGATWATDAKAVNFGAYGFKPDGTLDDGIQGLGLITIYWTGSEMVDARNYYVPQYITIQNLKLTRANIGYQFTNSAGVTRKYSDGVAGIYAVRVQHLSVENCEITDNNNGVFTNTRGQSSADHSAYMIFRRNQIYLNGNPAHSTEHNLYIQGARSLYEGNFLGQAYGGSTIKDRSSGTVIRYNHIQASARALDLVETEEEYVQFVQLDPLYDHAWVYGNVITNDINLPLSNTNNTLSARPIHFGHDNTVARTRKGTLFFYGNTYVQRSVGPGYYYTSVFQVGGNDDDYPYLSAHVEANGNVFWNDDGSTIWYFIASNRVGRVVLNGTNYVPSNQDPTEAARMVLMARRNADLSYQLDASGSIVWTASTTHALDTSAHTAIVGDSRSNSPQLDPATLLPSLSSPVLNRGIAGPSFTPAGAAAANLVLRGQPTLPFGIQSRSPRGSAMALGAKEPL